MTVGWLRAKLPPRHTSAGRRVWLTWLLRSISFLPAVAAPAKVDFNREVRPILSEHCYACHGPDENKRKSGLRLAWKRKRSRS